MLAVTVNNPAPQRVRVVERPTMRPGPGEVLVKIRAVSLNRRDLAFLDGSHPAAPKTPLVPCSDMAGRVIETGEGVECLAVGDTVVTTLLPDWWAGRPQAAWLRPAYGPGEGVAAQYRVFRAADLVGNLPAHLNAFEAACLPCAATTAWSALTAGVCVSEGATVVVPGSGGLSTFAIQFARALGARVISLTGDDAKGRALLDLGAAQVINYRHTPAWGDAVLALTDGLGADIVIDFAAPGGIANALACIAAGGTISLLGGLSSNDLAVPPAPLFSRAARIQGIAAGSRESMRAMLDFICAHKLRPIVQPPFPMESAAEAFAALKSAKGVGNICLSLA